MKAIMNLAIFLASFLLLLLTLPAAQVDARPCDGGLGHPNQGKNFILDLSSSSDNIRLSRNVFGKTGLDQVTITVDGVAKVLRPKDMVTAAEFIAAKQVLQDGTQDILIGTNGVATGGNFSVNDAIQPGHLSSLVIPADVVGIWAADKPVYNITRVLQLLPEGILVGVTGTSDALTIKTGSLDVGSLAKLTTIVTPALAAAVSALAPNVNQTLDLNLFTQCACRNAGEISASGNLFISANSNIVNSGTISSLNGSVTLTGTPGQDLLINNVGGQITALAGDINFRLPNFSASSALNVAGGVLDALRINVNGGNGPATIDVVEIIGTVQGRAGSAAVTTAQGTLDVGTLTTSRGAITLTGGENVAINSADDPNHLLATLSGDIKIIALNGDLTLGDSTKISAEGGNIIALASGNVVGGTGMTLTAKAAKNGNQNDQGQNDNGQGNNNDQGQNDNGQGNNNNQGENDNGGQGVIVGGGIHIGAGLTSSNELRDLLSTQPAPFRTSPDPLPTIGLNVNNNGTGLVKVEPASGLGITLNNGGSVSNANVNGGVILLQAESGSTVTMNGSTLNTFLPISYTEESPVTERKDELVVDTGEDDPGLFDDEVVASK